MKHLLKFAILGLTLATSLHATATELPAAIPQGVTQNSWKTVPTLTITAGGVDYAHRELGKSNGGTPVVLLVHLAAVLDNRNPRIVDGMEAGKAFLARLQERSENRDTEIRVAAYIAQLQALSAWVRKKPADLSVIKQPVLVVNGEHDRMVPTLNTHELARRLANSSLIVYPDAGHGGIFQFHADFGPSALAFLVR